MKTRHLTSAELQVPGRVLIKRKQLLQKIPLSARTILDMEKRGEFPKRFTITARLVAWDLAEIEEWIIAQRDAATQASPPNSSGYS